MIITYNELSTLTVDLGFGAHALYSVSNNIEKHYIKAKIPKRSGGERELSVPDKFLKAIQKSIANNILCHDEISGYATAYRYGGSTIKNAMPHIGQPVILKLDIRHFYDSIIYPMIKDKVFPKNRYSEKNRVLLALLCSYKGCLPQGAPTSPAISNIVMKDFDNTVGSWCSKRKIRYTRYCDDMTFSGNFNSDEVAEFIKGELLKMGFFLNDKKTVTVLDGQQKNVTGIVVNEKLNVPSDYRKNIRKEIYYCKKFGVKSHIEHKKISNSEITFLQKLLGKINYVISVNPNDDEMQNYKKYIVNEIKNYVTNERK